LETKINEITKSERELEVTLSYDEIKDDIVTEVKKQSQKIQLPGFRKGKAPITLLKKIYGDALEYEASEKVANDRFWKIAKDKELDPIGQPKLIDIKFNPNEDLHFKVKYEVVPQIEIKDYKDQEIEIPDFKVTEEEVEKEIEHILKSNATHEDTDLVGNNNDYTLEVELQRINDKGEPFEGAKKETMQIDLSNAQINPEIPKNAKGKKVGESFNFSFKDEHVHKDEEGKEEKVEETYSYTAEIKSIKKVILPKLDEDLIKKVTGEKVSNENDFRKDIKKDIQSYYDKRVDEILRNKLISLIVEKNNFTPPTSIVENVLGDYIQKEQEHIKKHNHKPAGKEELEKDLKPVAEYDVKWFLLKGEIEKKENILVSDDDLKELAKTESEKIGVPEDKLLNYYKTSNYKGNLLDQKLFEFLKNNNKIVKVDPETYSKKQKENK
jgi:trigger factor